MTTDDAGDRAWYEVGHREVFDGRTLSDLFVNVVPVAIIAAFVALFSLLPLYGSGSEPLLAFHAAIVLGVALVSYVAARAIAGDERLLGAEGEPARGGVRGPTTADSTEGEAPPTADGEAGATDGRAGDDQPD